MARNKNLHLITRYFVGGTVVRRVKDEYISNNFPGYSAAHPVQGHGWLDSDPDEKSLKVLESGLGASPSGRCSTQFDPGDESRDFGMMTLAAA